jgi:hypothetical protein
MIKSADCYRNVTANNKMRKQTLHEKISCAARPQVPDAQPMFGFLDIAK